MHLPEFERSNTLGVLIGNSRVLWGELLQSLAADPTLLERDHPLDTYVTQELQKITGALETTTELRFSYEEGDRIVAMQAISELSGLAPLRTGMLNIHPIYGPWIALRAVVICDLNAEGVELEEPPTLPTGWEDACGLAFKEACSAAGDTLSPGEIKANWRRWLKVRDACPIGREYRYCERQILYHYTQDRSVLQAAVAELPQT